jgi:hypothetical protein
MQRATRGDTGVWSPVPDKIGPDMGTDDKSSPDPATLAYIRPLEVGPESKRYLRAAINCGATSLVIWLCLIQS